MSILRDTRLRRALALGAALAAAAACAEAPTRPSAAARAPVTISATLTPAQQATIAGMSVEVSGPGITTPIIVTLSVSGATVNGTVSVPVGASRTFTVRAYDAQGTETYNGSATATVVAGTNPPLAVRMTALEGSVPIDVTIGTYGVTLTPPTASVAVGAEVTLTANATASGATAPGPLTWGVLNPALVTLTVAGDGRSAVVRGRVAGSTRVVASYAGVAAASTITVAAPANVPPTVTTTGPYVASAGVPVTFTAIGSDADGTVVGYRWVLDSQSTPYNTTTGTLTLTFGAAGSHTFTVVAIDDDGATSMPSMTQVTVGPPPGNQPPFVNINGPYSGVVNTSIQFTSNGTGDPDGSIVSYDWSFGDAPNSVSGLAFPTHTYAAAGTYTVTLTVRDNAGAATTRTTTATISNPPPNQPPTVSIQPQFFGTVGNPVSIFAGCTDPEGAPIAQWTFVFSNSPSTFTSTTGFIQQTFSVAGTYQVAVACMDNKGAISPSRTAIITIQ